MNIAKYKVEIIVGLSILFFLIIIIFRKPIFGWLNKRPPLVLPITRKPITFATFTKKKVNKTEELCRQIFEDIFGRPFPSVRPTFLKNPTTGRNLELDGYNAELSLAFEYNGVQHAQHSPFFHRKEGDYDSQQERDRLKREMCNNQKPKIRLITIPHTVPVKKLRSYIMSEIKKLAISESD